MFGGWAITAHPRSIAQSPLTIASRWCRDGPEDPHDPTHGTDEPDHPPDVRPAMNFNAVTLGRKQ
jgi:hypothetical protein